MIANFTYNIFRNKKRFFLFICFILVSTTLLFAFKGSIKSLFVGTKPNGNVGNGKCIDCATMFDDNVAAHEAAYLNEGIEPLESDDQIYQFFLDGQLQELKTNDKYIISDLAHSKPYILPKGKRFIEKLADLYEDKCYADSLTYVPFTITSVTRSIESVRKLMRGNGNAIENSAHLKGKTFDMSYRAFNGNKKQLRLFTLALSELREAKKCFAKYERNGCLHITAN